MTIPIKADVPTARRMGHPHALNVGTVKDPPPIPTNVDIKPIAPPNTERGQKDGKSVRISTILIKNKDAHHQGQ